MRFIFLMQARLGSTRFPSKTLAPILGGKTLLELVYARVLESKEATKENVYLLTSDSLQDDQLISFAQKRGILYARGSEQDVYKRFYDFLISYTPKPDYLIRVCCDNPFLDTEFIDQMTEFLKNTQEEKPDYLSYEDSTGRPAMLTHYGFFCEAISYDAFMGANSLDLTDAEKEHVTPKFYKSDPRTSPFSAKFLPMPKEIERKPYRFTVDTANDIQVVKTIAGELPAKFSYREVIAIADMHPELGKIMAEAVMGNTKTSI